METMRKLVAIALTLLALGLLAGCPRGVQVHDLNNNPGKYFGKEVAVRGTVVTSFGALGIGAYEVDDGTGRIWVLSEGYGVPGKGAQLTVAGNFIQGASIAGRNFGLALRQTHRAR